MGAYKTNPTRQLCVLSLMLCPATVSAQETPLPPLTEYPLPLRAAASVQALAARSDVLVMGELHGTKEVPQVTHDLLPDLDRLGYHALAIEVPADQQPVLAKWAAGGSSRVPGFYNGLHGDGRGNVQMLTLIRIALSAPYHSNSRTWRCL